MKNVTLLGGVAKDPVQRNTSGGNSVVGFSLAVDDGWGDNKKTIYFDCSIWGKRGEAVLNYVTKGSKLCVTGGLSIREYEGKTYLTVNVDNFTFAGGGQQRQGGGSDKPQSGGYAEHGGSEGVGSVTLDDEVPF